MDTPRYAVIVEQNPLPELRRTEGYCLLDESTMRAAHVRLGSFPCRHLAEPGLRWALLEWADVFAWDLDFLPVYFGPFCLEKHIGSIFIYFEPYNCLG